MNNKDVFKNLLVFCFITLLQFSSNSYAFDMEVLQEQCAEIGFKIKTPANGNCVLRLLNTEKAAVAKEQANINQQVLQAQQSEASRQQQEEMRELQRRSVEAQEAVAQARATAAQAQKSAVFNNALQNSMQMINGTGPYARTQPQQPDVLIIQQQAPSQPIQYIAPIQRGMGRY